MSERVVAVVVTYFPDPAGLEALLDALAGQVSEVVVVDNGSDGQVDRLMRKRGDGHQHVVSLGDNLGVATAHNVGIDWARERGAGFVILFDQDSLPAPHMVARLRQAYEALVAEGRRVAAVGPNYLDERQQDRFGPFIRYVGLKIVSAARDEGLVVETDHLISSGCLLPLSVIAAVGGMRDELFIDCVDIEWSLRAKSFGYQCFGVLDAHMGHSLGGDPIVASGKTIPMHSPLRNYYIFRNAVWLYRQGYVPLNWKIIDAWVHFKVFMIYSIFARPRWRNARMMTLGIIHGLRGRLGKYGPADPVCQ